MNITWWTEICWWQLYFYLFDFCFAASACTVFLYFSHQFMLVFFFYMHVLICSNLLSVGRAFSFFYVFALFLALKLALFCSLYFTLFFSLQPALFLFLQPAVFFSLQPALFFLLQLVLFFLLQSARPSHSGSPRSSYFDSPRSSFSFNSRFSLFDLTAFIGFVRN